MKIGTCQSEKGKLCRGDLVVAEDSHANSVAIPIWIAEGRKEGKTAWFSAGVHGDEINGIEVLRRFILSLQQMLESLSGTIIFLPLINVSGFRAKNRFVQYDGKDLNRCFPGDREGSVSEKMAHAIFHKVISICDFGLDVHDSGKGSVLLPHPRAHIMDEAGGYDQNRMRSIATFGTDIIMLTRGMDGVMTIEASRQFGILAFTVEIGGGFILWEPFIERAVIGLKNVLIDQGMLPGKLILPHEQYIIPGADDLQIKAKLEGILHSKVSLGEAVNAGQVLAEIVSPMTLEQEVIRATACGVVHDLNVHAKVNVGEDVVGILEFTTCPTRGCKPSRDNVEIITYEASDRVQIRRSEVFDAALSLRI